MFGPSSRKYYIGFCRYARNMYVYKIFKTWDVLPKQMAICFEPSGIIARWVANTTVIAYGGKTFEVHAYFTRLIEQSFSVSNKASINSIGHSSN